MNKRWKKVLAFCSSAAVILLIITGWSVHQMRKQETLDARLISAVEDENAERVKKLLLLGADANASKVPPTGVAAGSSSLRKIVHAILTLGRESTGAQIDAPSALQLACGLDNPAIVTLLTEHRANVRIMDEEGITPLMIIAGKSYESDDRPPYQLKSAKVLIEYGADVNARDKSKQTPLMYAVMWGRIDIIKVLLEHGADANATDGTRHVIQQGTGDSATVKLLKQYGAKQ